MNLEFSEIVYLWVDLAVKGEMQQWTLTKCFTYTSDTDIILQHLLQVLYEPIFQKQSGYMDVCWNQLESFLLGSYLLTI